jgi:hypothetical protein
MPVQARVVSIGSTINVTFYFHFLGSLCYYNNCYINYEFSSETFMHRKTSAPRSLPWLENLIAASNT